MKVSWWIVFWLLICALVSFVTLVPIVNVSEPAISPAKPSVHGEQLKLETPAPASVPSRSFIALQGDGPFAPRIWQAPMAPVVASREVTPISAPIVADLPPMPFRFAGKLDLDDGTATVYLSKGDEAFSLSMGDVFDTNYRFIAVENGKVVIEYLPLAAKQYLPMNSD